MAAQDPPERVSWVRRTWHRGRRVADWVLRTRPYRTFSHFTNVGGGVLTAGMSYLAIFASFAALAVGFGVLGVELRSRPTLLDVLVEQINGFAPGLLGYEGSEGAVQVDTLLTETALSVTTIIALVSLLWVAMSWFTGTRRSIRIIFGLEVKQYRAAVLLKLRDLIGAALFGLMFLVSAALTVLSTTLFNDLLEWLAWDVYSWLLDSMGRVVRYGAVLVFDMAILLAMHVYLAEVKVPKWNLLSGCLLGAIALGALKMLGAELLGGSTSNPLLASFAVIIGLLIWFNLICRTLLLTSSWIATGLDEKLGAPERLVSDDRAR